MIKVLPSSNPEKEDNLVQYAKHLENLGVEYLHCDVMDGVFVENKCLPIDIINSVRINSNILLDVHLMIANPEKRIKDYVGLRPNIITIHYESVKSKRTIRKLAKIIKSQDIMFGLSIKPNTPVTALVDFVDILDLILIMSVEPGKSGQKFIPSSIQKIKDAKSLINDKNIVIEVDGGVNLDNYQDIVRAGADFLVMGSAFYKSKEKNKLLYTIDKHYPKVADKN